MDIISCCKLQIGCLILLLYMGFLFVKEGCELNNKTGKALCNHFFDRLFILGELCVLTDGITAYTVNHSDTIPDIINRSLHIIFLVLYQVFICEHFLYWMDRTLSRKQGKRLLMICRIPLLISVIITVMSAGSLYYEQGAYTAYSQGRPVTMCFICVAFYVVLTIAVFLSKSRYIETNKMTSFIMSFSAVIIISLLQLFIQEALFSALAVVLTIVSLYLVMENPTLKEVEAYHEEMIMGFATLVENKDDSTGGHIRRTSMYVEIIADELRKNPRCHHIITKDFMKDLKKAAPMHDIGKIGIPDVVLQKPGKLTDEEYTIMKRHPEIGGKIIEDTFGHLLDDKYENMAYQVAMYHHEKWNGRGYPSGLSGEAIPLCARIMAVADVFDAVSAKRCYRDAMPIDRCLQIIADGRGTDFDPDVVDAFMNRIDEIRAIVAAMNQTKETA